MCTSSNHQFSQRGLVRNHSSSDGHNQSKDDDHDEAHGDTDSGCVTREENSKANGNNGEVEELSDAQEDVDDTVDDQRTPAVALLDLGDNDDSNDVQDDDSDEDCGKGWSEKCGVSYRWQR